MCVCLQTHIFLNVFLHVQVPPCACYILLVIVGIFLMPSLPGPGLDVLESAGLGGGGGGGGGYGRKSESMCGGED